MTASALVIALAGRHIAWLAVLTILFAGTIAGLERLLRLRLERSPLFIEGEA